MARAKTNQTIRVESYFDFSRSQRRAMIIMVFAAIGVGYYIQWRSGAVDEPETSSFVDTGKLKTMFSGDSSKLYSATEFKGKKFERNVSPKRLEPAPIKGNLSFFDPNKAGFEELIALGLGEKAAMNLIHFREKGGRFRKPEDLAKLYSLKPAEIERLKPFVRMEETPAVTGVSGSSNAGVPGSTAPEKHKPMAILVNINRSDSITWQLLPGIGAKRASAILKFREKLGGFISIEQVGETYGLPDSVFQKIKANLEWQPGQIEQLSLNTASEAELKAHPYIGWQWAKIIVAYRTQHGNYQTVDDLMKIHIMKKEWLEQVRPYLKTD